MKSFKTLSGITLLSIALPVFAFAQDATVTQTPSTTTYNASCASSAVIAQENSIQALQDTFAASMKTAAMARRDALAAAYLNTDATARATAIQAAQDTFRTAEQAARKTQGDAMKTLQDSFKKTMDGCGAQLQKPEMMEGGDGKDNQDHQQITKNNTPKKTPIQKEKKGGKNDKKDKKAPKKMMQPNQDIQNTRPVDNTTTPQQ
ncbi:MAG: hypothetical protein WCQ32_03210 [bacterium]